MKKIISVLGIAGFIICLLIMYNTDIGHKGMQKYDSDFKLLDMRFHYTANDVVETFAKLGVEGRAAYRNFWILDFVFIACFLIVMFIISDKLAMNSWTRNILLILAIARAGFDILENSLLLYLSSIYPVRNDFLATICSWSTTSKFIMLYTWVICIAAMFICRIYPIIRQKMKFFCF